MGPWRPGTPVPCLSLLGAPAFSAPLCARPFPPSVVRLPLTVGLPRGGEWCVFSVLAPDSALSQTQSRHQKEYLGLDAHVLWDSLSSYTSHSLALLTATHGFPGKKG